MLEKPKFDKKKCRKCKWHGQGVGYPVRFKNGNGHMTTLQIHCNYAAYDEHTSPLRPNSDGTSYDLRGDDYDNCLFFEKGVPQKVGMNIMPSYETLEKMREDNK